MDKTILHVITGLGDGGAEATLYKLCTFSKNNHVVVSLLSDGKYGALLKSKNITVYCLRLNKFINVFNSLFVFRKIINKHNPDVVQTWMYHANLFGGVFGSIFGVRNIVWGIHHSQLERKHVRLSVYLVAKANIFFSKSLLNFLNS